MFSLHSQWYSLTGPPFECRRGAQPVFFTTGRQRGFRAAGSLAAFSFLEINASMDYNEPIVAGS
jgi:hypothetical protein